MQWVFETLGIDKSADVSTVRKAYARALKQCDQAAEAERFQRIRQAYEWALQWARQQEMAATAALGASPQEPSVDLSDETEDQLRVRTPANAVRLDENEDLSRQVFDEFAAAITLGPAEIGTILAKFAQDVRLTALDAKALFEQTVLVRAFTQPVDIELLDAASDLFAWDTSSRHLAAVRPDLVHRLLRQQTLRRLLAGNGGTPMLAALGCSSIACLYWTASAGEAGNSITCMTELPGSASETALYARGRICGFA